MNKILKKPVCLTFLLAAVVYGITLPLLFGNDPFDPLGTLSVLCGERKPYFWAWVIIDCGAFFLNTNYLFKKIRLQKQRCDRAVLRGACQCVRDRFDARSSRNRLESEAHRALGLDRLLHILPFCFPVPFLSAQSQKE